jgi:hypothetical protein
MCKNLKKKLAQMDQEFTSVDVDLLDSGEQWLKTKELKNYNPDSTYPTMVVEEIVLDFSEHNLKKTLNKKEDNE